MNIAITGGNGFIGSHISKMIKELGHKVIFISRIKKK
jgi:nucleoside-diphosphate-sugar epimerase